MLSHSKVQYCGSTYAPDGGLIISPAMVIQCFKALELYPKKFGWVTRVTNDTVRLKREILVEPPVRLLTDVAIDSVLRYVLIQLVSTSGT